MSRNRKPAPFHVTFGKSLPRWIRRAQQEIESLATNLEGLDRKVADCQEKLDIAIDDGKPNQADKAGKELEQIESDRGQTNRQLKRARSALSGNVEKLKSMMSQAEERVEELTHLRRYRHAAALKRDINKNVKLLAELEPTPIEIDDLDALLVVETQERKPEVRKTAAA